MSPVLVTMWAHGMSPVLVSQGRLRRRRSPVLVGQLRRPSAAVRGVSPVSPAAEVGPRGIRTSSQQQQFLGPAYSCDPSPFAHPKEVNAGQKFLGPAYACDPSPYAHPKEYRGQERKRGEGKKHVEGQIDGIRDPEGWRKSMRARDVQAQRFWDDRERLDGPRID